MDDGIKAYLASQQAVAEMELQELQTATVELRWHRLNALIGMAMDLGLFIPANVDFKVIQRWEKQKS